jgi:hypothetical protein
MSASEQRSIVRIDRTASVIWGVPCTVTLIRRTLLICTCLRCFSYSRNTPLLITVHVSATETGIIYDSVDPLHCTRGQIFLSNFIESVLRQQMSEYGHFYYLDVGGRKMLYIY